MARHQVLALVLASRGAIDVLLVVASSSASPVCVDRAVAALGNLAIHVSRKLDAASTAQLEPVVDVMLRCVITLPASTATALSALSTLSCIPESLVSSRITDTAWSERLSSIFAACSSLSSPTAQGARDADIADEFVAIRVAASARLLCRLPVEARALLVHAGVVPVAVQALARAGGTFNTAVNTSEVLSDMQDAVVHLLSWVRPLVVVRGAVCLSMCILVPVVVDVDMTAANVMVTVEVLSLQFAGAGDSALSAIVDSGGVDVFVRQLCRRSIDNDKRLHAVLEALVLLCRRYPTRVLRHVADPAVVRCLVDLAAYRDTSGISAPSLWLLVRLSLSSDHAAAVVARSGASSVLLHAVGSEHASVAESALRGLAAMMETALPAIQEVLLNGGCARVVEALQRGFRAAIPYLQRTLADGNDGDGSTPMSPGVAAAEAIAWCRASLRAVGVLAAHSAEARAVLRRMGTLPLIATAMPPTDGRPTVPLVSLPPSLSILLMCIPLPPSLS
jgi:hypothetical protein